MAKLPARQKVNVLCFRRADPDEILVVTRAATRGAAWALPSGEVEGETVREAALRRAARLVDEDPLSDFDLALTTEYRVNSGPRAGDWTERFHAIEVAPGCPTIEGRWLPHYEAKAETGADAPRVREAITRLRERAKLKP